MWFYNQRVKLLDRKAFQAIDRKKNPDKYARFGTAHVGIDLAGSAGGAGGAGGGSMVWIMSTPHGAAGTAGSPPAHPNCRTNVTWHEFKIA